MTTSPIESPVRSITSPGNLSATMGSPTIPRQGQLNFREDMAILSPVNSALRGVNYPGNFFASCNNYGLYHLLAPYCYTLLIRRVW